jgi:hypothetical protein
MVDGRVVSSDVVRVRVYVSKLVSDRYEYIPTVYVEKYPMISSELLSLASWVQDVTKLDIKTAKTDRQLAKSRDYFFTKYHLRV